MKRSSSHVDNEDTQDEGKMATQFSKYADIIVGFHVLQSLAITFKLLENENQSLLSRHLIAVGCLVLLAGITYIVLILNCSTHELRFRSAAGQSNLVVSAAQGLRNWRTAIVGAFIVVTELAMIALLQSH
jgi:hypothetical protein